MNIYLKKNIKALQYNISNSLRMNHHRISPIKGLGGVDKNTTAQYFIRHYLVLTTPEEAFVCIHTLLAIPEARE